MHTRTTEVEKIQTYHPGNDLNQNSSRQTFKMCSGKHPHSMTPSTLVSKPVGQYMEQGIQTVKSIFNDRALTSDLYMHLLQNTVYDWYEELPLQHAYHVWLQHHGVPPHKTTKVYVSCQQIWPIDHYENYGLVEWSLHSPDLTPMDFYLWRYIKAQVCLSLFF